MNFKTVQDTKTKTVFKRLSSLSIVTTVIKDFELRSGIFYTIYIINIFIIYIVSIFGI